MLSGDSGTLQRMILENVSGEWRERARDNFNIIGEINR